MKKTIPFIFLITLIFNNEAYAQLIEPQNPCPPEKEGNISKDNSESNPFNSIADEAYRICISNYYEALEAYNKKAMDYELKSREIRGRIESYMGGGNRKDGLIGKSKSQGFAEQKLKIFTALKNDLERLQTGLTLSFELNKYCIGTANCADENIKYFREKIDAVNKEIGDVIRIKPTEEN